MVQTEKCKYKQFCEICVSEMQGVSKVALQI
jgi:hypothetical protein